MSLDSNSYLKKEIFFLINFYLYIPLILPFLSLLEIIEFLRLGGANQPIAFCIVKISVLSSTIIGLSTHGNDENFVKIEKLIEGLKALPKAREW